VTAPASYSRVLALLKRLSPIWPSTDEDKAVGKELGSIATALGMGADPLDAALDEVFPDTTSVLLTRWEKVARVATRTGDTDDTRRSRILSVLRRSSGPRIDQLGKMLEGPLGISTDDMVFVEMLRSFIDEALTESSGTLDVDLPTTAPPFTLLLGKPWPGLVDGDSTDPLLVGAGVSVYLNLSGLGVCVATLTSPDGTVWTIPVNQDTAWYTTRTVFTGLPAAGKWRLDIYDSTGPQLVEWKLRVSNNVDSAQIFNFFVLRDPALSGTVDLFEAQRLFDRTALAQMRAFVVETLAFICGDPHSLCGRDPIGA
jgi:hypothetical protein